jgi:hypothetical protein
VYWRGFFPGSDREPDRITAEKLWWDDARRTLRTSPLPDAASPLFLTAVGGYPSVTEARRARAANGDCLASFAVLAAPAHLGRPAGKFVIGALSATREAAEAVQHAATRCVPASRVSVVILRPRS